jgi:Protein of unknown function (DUF2934)
MSLDLEQQIRERAYYLWEQDGRVHGRADHHWFAAANELSAGQATAARVLAKSSDIIVTDVAEPAPRKRSSTKAPKAATVAPAARRTRRSPSTTLSS